MNPQTFFYHFERLTDAPNAVARLRELVLQLAVQGKLVEQDERDEAATCLLERIKTERKRLVREKKIKEAKPLPPVSDDKKPFELPSGWAWARFGEVTINRDGERVPVEKSIREQRQGEYDYYGASGVIDRFDDYIFDKPLLLIGEDGANLINRSTPIAFIAHGKYWVNNHAHVLDSISFDCLQYLELYINATDLRPYITGTAQPKMNQAKMNLIPVAVPPLEEQKRIVAKVDELMRLCDELERVQAERRGARQRLNRAAFDQLLAARDAAEFQAGWQMVSDHFPTLTATPYQISKLRQTILQLAVQGKLTRQDPQDKLAPALLRRIHAERERLVKEKRLKRADPLPPVNPNEITFALPSGWTWARLDELLLSLRNGIAIPPSETGNTRILRISALRPNFVNLSEYRFLPEDSSVYEEFKIEAGDLLFTRYSGNRDFVGICGVVPPHAESFIHPDKLIRGCLIKNGVIPEFAALAINTGASRSFIERLLKTTAGQVGVAGRDLKLVPVPVPPLEEQKRIVAAVNRLMALCDELESGLRRAEEDGERLLRAAVRSLLAPALDNSLRVPALA